jgi:hypothetical protein
MRAKLPDREGFTDRDGIKIHYEVYGNGSETMCSCRHGASCSRVFELQIGIFGVIMLLFLILEPRGLAGIWARVRPYFELWPFKYRAWES